MDTYAQIEEGTSVPADYEEAISRERECKTETTEQEIRGCRTADPWMEPSCKFYLSGISITDKQKQLT